MNIEEYLNENISTRQAHLKLEEDCLERGGNSAVHRGVLAEYLNGNIYSKPADLCHACNNPKCSNPRHLYWGSRSENVKDSVRAGTWVNPYQTKVNELGEIGAKKFFSEKSKYWHENNKIPQHKNTIYVNDGKITKRILKTDDIPEGWNRGRLKYNTSK